MKVHKCTIRTPTEEHRYLLDQLDKFGNYFSWEEHPNRIRATAISTARIRKKITALLKTEEFLEENPLYRYKECMKT